MNSRRHIENERRTVPREIFPVVGLLPAAFEALKCTESSHALELFQVYRLVSLFLGRKSLAIDGSRYV